MIKKLTRDDFFQYKTIRLEALKDNPFNFISTFTEEEIFDNQNWQEIITKSNLFGYFVAENLAGVAGFYQENKKKILHIATIYGMYVKPEFRNLNIALKLVNHVKNIIPKEVKQIHLGCNANNIQAINFYRKCGFKIYGTRPNYAKVDEKFYDDVIMICEL